MTAKEMNELLDVALKYANDVGVVDSEIESLRVELYD